VTQHGPNIKGIGQRTELNSLCVMHVSFARHYVTVTSRNADLLSQFARNIGPMLALGPVGVPAGAFHVTDVAGEFVIRDGVMIAAEGSCDLHSTARSLHHCVIKRFIEVRPDLLWIHAAALQFAGCGIVLVGSSGQGKSTMVDALLNWDCSYFSDEVAPIDSIRVAVLPFPVAPCKRITMGARLPTERIHELAKVPVHVAPGAVGHGPVPISQIYFLCHDTSCSTTRFDLCSPAVAVVELLRNSFNSKGSRGTEVARLCELTSRVNTAYLHYADANEAASQVIVAASLAQPSA
jgi:hypothetical protein